MSDFTKVPLDKQFNPENILSRLEKLERLLRARPSARAGKLSELAQNTGNLTVDSLTVVDGDDGLPNITIDRDGGLSFRNQVGAIIFENLTGANFDDVLVFISGSDSLTFKNAVGGKTIRFHIDDASHNVAQHYFDYDGLHLASSTSTLDFGGETIVGMSAGLYTPTITGASTDNVDSASASGDFMYMRTGNIVAVAGTVNVDPTAAGVLTDVGITLPVTSNFAAATDAAGTAGAQGNDDVGSILADTTNDRAILRFTANVTTNQAFRVMFMYVVI